MEASGEISLAQAVQRVRLPIEKRMKPMVEQLRAFAVMVELNELEWCKVPENDVDNQKWARYLMQIAKEEGWFRQCVENGILPKNYLRWPDHEGLYPVKLKPVKPQSKSVKLISGGAFEQNRRKH